MKLRACGRPGGGGAMSAVIRGSGSVLGPLDRCQSFSASLRMPTSARSMKIPEQDEHLATDASPTARDVIVPWQRGHVISSMLRPYSAETERSE